MVKDMGMVYARLVGGCMKQGKGDLDGRRISIDQIKRSNGIFSRTRRN